MMIVLRENLDLAGVASAPSSASSSTSSASIFFGFDAIPINPCSAGTPSVRPHKAAPGGPPCPWW
jgi:hypothetical protein